MPIDIIWIIISFLFGCGCSLFIKSEIARSVYNENEKLKSQNEILKQMISDLALETENTAKKLILTFLNDIIKTLKDDKENI